MTGVGVNLSSPRFPENPASRALRDDTVPSVPFVSDAITGWSPVAFPMSLPRLAVAGRKLPVFLLAPRAHRIARREFVLLVLFMIYLYSFVGRDVASSAGILLNIVERRRSTLV